jgi:hypothetical protein
MEGKGRKWSRKRLEDMRKIVDERKRRCWRERYGEKSRRERKKGRPIPAADVT